MMFGLNGCFLLNNPPLPKPDPKPADGELTQEELWDYLDDYSCFMTMYGISDAVIVFSNNDNLNIDSTHLSYGGLNILYDDVKSFSYEGENIYKVEYNNSHASFESSEFYIEFDPAVKNRLKFGTYYSGELVYVDYYADEGLTTAELIEAIAKYDYWLEISSLFGANFVSITEDDMFYHGLMNSSYGRIGNITKNEYLGLTRYEITIDYPAMPDGIDPGYDAYCKTYNLCFNPYTEVLEFEDVNGNNKWFYPDRGLSKDNLFAHIGDNTYLSADKQTRLMFAIKNNKYFIEIEDLELESVDVFEVISTEYKGIYVYETVVFNGAENETWYIYYNYLDANNLIASTSYFYLDMLREY